MKKRVSRLVRLLSETERIYRIAPWQPRVDIYRCSHGWLIKLELAGIDETAVDMAIQGSTLHVRGIRRDEIVREGNETYSMEISYNRFERVIELPSSLSSARISSEYRDGMMIIRVHTEENQ